MVFAPKDISLSLKMPTAFPKVKRCHGERIDLRLRRVPGCTQTVAGQGVRRVSDFVDGLSWFLILETSFYFVRGLQAKAPFIIIDRLFLTHRNIAKVFFREKLREKACKKPFHFVPQTRKANIFAHYRINDRRHRNGGNNHEKDPFQNFHTITPFLFILHVNNEICKR